MDDVIIIGAGPAGSTAARLLSQRGKHVRVLEKSAFPRKKPCGGAITSRALPLLPQSFQNHVLSAPVFWTFRGRKGARTIPTSRPFCYTVDRTNFDAWLAVEAERSGAKIVFGTTVTAFAFDGEEYLVKTSQGYYRSRYLVGADGAKGISAKYFGLSRAHNGAALETEIPLALAKDDMNRVEIDVSRYPWGYAWVIPHGSTANIGIGSFKAGKLPSLKHLLQDYMKRAVPGLGTAPILAHPLPYRTHFSPLAIHHGLLIGDAAGLMDGFSAEGIYSALYSAHVAAEVINAACENKTSTDPYNTLIRERLWSQLKPALKMSRLFYPLAGFWADWFLKHTQLLEEYLALTQGDSTYDRLLAKTQNTLLSQLHFRSLAR